MHRAAPSLSCNASADAESCATSRLRDSEYLIRVFVRLRASGSDLASSNRVSEIVHLNTQYNLPLAPVPRKGEQRIEGLVRMFQSLRKNHDELMLEFSYQLEAMRVRVTHDAHEDLVYLDADTGLQIPYPEYEMRYYQHCAFLRAASDLLAAETQTAEDEQMTQSLSPRSQSDLTRQFSAPKLM